MAKASIRLSLALALLSLTCAAQGASRGDAHTPARGRGDVLSDVPREVDRAARYLFYLHGKIVERGRRPTHPQHGVYEYDRILDEFGRGGFVVISEQREKETDVERYAAKLAGQIRRLLAAGVPPEHVTVVGASQGSWMAMLASTYLGDRRVNFVIIAACSADEGFLELVNLHGNVLSIYERSDLAGSCRKYRADATGLGAYEEIELNTGLRHAFLYRPMKEWVGPAVAWARRRAAPDGAEREVREKERAYRDALARGDTAATAALLADDFVATSSRGELRDKAKELDDMKPSPDFAMEGFEIDDINVRVFDGAAVVTGRQTLKVAFKGRSNTSLFRYTRVYAKRDGRWQVVAQQLTRLPPEQ